MFHQFLEEGMMNSRMSDAVHLEVSRHIDKLKVVNSKIRDLHDENKNSQGWINFYLIIECLSEID